MFLDPLIHVTNKFELPLTSFTAMLTMSICYIVVLSLVSVVMNSRSLKPVNLGKISFFHNLCLSLYSLYSFCGFVYVLRMNFSKASSSALSLLFCDKKGEMVAGDWSYWVYHFYLSKSFEWLDSLFLVLRGKKVIPPSNIQVFGFIAAKIFLILLSTHSTSSTMCQVRKN